jgi:hypothetical protein
MGLGVFGNPELPNGRRPNVLSSLTDDWYLVAKRNDLGYLMYTDRDVAIVKKL